MKKENVVIAVAPGEIGKVSGTFSMLRQLGGAFGVAIVAAVFAGFGNYASAQSFSNGFDKALGVSAVPSLLGAFVGLVLPGRQAREAEASKHEATGVPEHSPR